MPPRSSEEERFRFPKAERLRHRRAFDFLFKHGSSFRIGMLKFFYVTDCPEDFIDASLSVAFAAPKRSFKRAVDRNRLKRRMKEAYRLHKFGLLSKTQENKKNVALLIIYNSRRMAPYASIEDKMNRGLIRLQKTIFPPQPD